MTGAQAGHQIPGNDETGDCKEQIDTKAAIKIRIESDQTRRGPLEQVKIGVMHDDDEHGKGPQQVEVGNEIFRGWRAQRGPGSFFIDAPTCQMAGLMKSNFRCERHLLRVTRVK